MEVFTTMDKDITDVITNQREHFKLRVYSPTNITESHSSLGNGGMPNRLVLESDNYGSDIDCKYNIDSDECVQTESENVSDRDNMSGDELDYSNQRVENSMDDAIEQLTGASTFEWDDNFDSFRGTREVFTGPDPGAIRDYDSAYNAFIDIWSDDILTLIVEETNKYAKQTISYETQMGTLKPESHYHQWKDTNTDEILILFAVHILMGIVIRPTVEYWSTDEWIEMPNFRKLLTMNRYLLLMEFLHFVDNSTVGLNLQQNEVDSGMIHKLLPIIVHLNAKFPALYNLGPEISIDESLTSFNGRSNRRSEIKSLGICESFTGYLYKFEIYMEKNSRLSSSAPRIDLEGNREVRVVLKLLKDLDKLGHLVMMDSHFNSPALGRHLKSLGFDCLGLLRCNRRNVPEIIHTLSKNTPPGQIVWRHCGDVSVVAWVDVKPVCIISTYYQMETYVDKRAGTLVMKPTGMLDYNQIMAGTYLKQRSLMKYEHRHPSASKWYVKMFRRLLDVSIYNAYVMFANSQKRRTLSSTTYREFRKQLANEIIERHRKVLEVSKQVEVDTRLRRDILHIPKYTSGRSARKRCFICYRNQKKSKLVHSHCETCEVYLCFGVCWAEWHSQPTLNGGNRIIRKKPRQLP